MTKTIRQPIVVMVGHVDHGKTSILDFIRKTSVAKTEAGGITQKISSVNISMDTIKKVCGDLLKQLKLKLIIPGILFIDTPGHQAFTNLRKRGGNLADIAILVIDIHDSIKPQTEEAIEILKTYKTPFIIALNKIDTIMGWQIKKDKTLIDDIKTQSERTRKILDNKLYELVGRLHEFGFNSERFDRVEDHTKQISMIPCSAKTGEGIPELIMTITGLSQKYLEGELRTAVKGPASGVVLEVRDEHGLGLILDTIVYDGTLKVNDQIVIGGLEEPIITKVRSLFKLEKNKFKPYKQAHAATNVIILAPEIKEVIAGMPFKVVEKDIKNIKEEIQKEVKEVLVETDVEGIVVKAESLGSLEALTNLLREKDIKIKRASIGDISKKDIAEASTEKNPLNKVILGFNVRSDIITPNVKLILNDIIYKLIEELEEWQKEELKLLEEKELEKVVKPCKIKILSGYVFRQSNPAIVGVEVLAGTLFANTSLMKEGKELTRIKSLQLEGKNIKEAKTGDQVAISLPGLIVGRQIHEGDVLLSDVPESDFRQLKKLKKYLNSGEIEILKEIAQIKRKVNKVWGV